MYERPANGCPVGEVADGRFDAVAPALAGAVSITDEGPHAHAARHQLMHTCGADVPGRAGHQDGHRAPPVLGGMLAFIEKRLAGS
jgi:hypothetical protein